jgi:ribosome maturation factor RimP
MISQSKILALIEGPMAQEKFFVVSLEVSNSNKIRLLIDSMKGVQIEDCVFISRIIEKGLDRETDDFELEVSSPGLDAPFRVPEQYIKNIGRQVEVLLKSGHTFTGQLLSADAKGFCMEVNRKVAQVGKKNKLSIKEKFAFVKEEVSKVKVVLKF